MPQLLFGLRRMPSPRVGAMLEPETEGRREMEAIVVGFDGSESARAAVAFAAQEAAAHGARLRVVCAWEVPYAAYAGGLLPPANLGPDLERSAAATARAGAEHALELEPSIYVEHEAIEGHPAKVLIAESSDTKLIVVGSRGHGGFASMLLGSVSHDLAQHAGCPVVIVPKA